MLLNSVVKLGWDEGVDQKFGLADANFYIQKWMNKVLLYSTVNCIQYNVNHNRKEYEKVYITESLCRTPESNTTL